MVDEQTKLLLLMFYFDGQFPWNIPYMLYYPVGVLYKVPFRYQKRWISEPLRNVDRYPLREALIVMKFGALEDGQEQRYIPIRKVIVTKCEMVGDYYYLYMKLGNLVEYEDKDLFQFSEQFRTLLGERDHHLLVCEADGRMSLKYTSPENESEDIAAWLRLAKLLGGKTTPRMEAYENMVFLKFQSVFSVSKQQIRPRPLQWSIQIALLERLAKKFDIARRVLLGLYDHLTISNFWGYDLRIGQTYFIRIVQFFHPDETVTFKPKDAILYLDMPKESFFIAAQTSPIVGHQDIHLLSLQTSTSHAIHTSLVVKPQEGKNPKYQIVNSIEQHGLSIPEIVVPIHVSHSLSSAIRMYVVPIMVFLVGSLLVTVGTSDQVSLPPWPFGNVIPFFGSIVFDAPIARVIQLALGLLLQAFGLFILKSDSK